MADLCSDYLKSKACPTEPNQLARVDRAIDLLLEVHLTTAVKDFGPVALEAWQDRLCVTVDDDGRKRWSRGYICDLVDVVRRIWKWGVRTQRVEPDKLIALKAVPRPAYGVARETPPRQPADLEDVRKTLPHLRTPVRAAVSLQLLVGARPSEMLQLRPVDVHRVGKVRIDGVGVFDVDAEKVWVYVPEKHKGKSRRKVRVIHFGPKAQEILRPFLERDPEAFCFSPQEAQAERREIARAARVEAKGNRGGSRKKKTEVSTVEPGERYFRQSYTQAVERACKKACVPKWTPYQLRHLRAEQIDEVFGPYMAAEVLGHGDLKTIETYAKKAGATKRAAKVARETG
ncbi:Phage integrase [Fimbriiglobus ruber]|uniref:Phage integrase n=1 Tax=Fimbriiglobus ruber TaxID=1908690 RepID=A0A225D5M1_9BACT|nr:Phage integrase [Fimbriiglobus ruber]